MGDHDELNDSQTWDDYMSRPFATYADDPEQCREQLRFLDSKGDPAPWIVTLMGEYGEFEGEAHITADPKHLGRTVAGGMFITTAMLAAVARNALPYLLDERDDLAAENAVLRRAVALLVQTGGRCGASKWFPGSFTRRDGTVHTDGHTLNCRHPYPHHGPHRFAPSTNEFSEEWPDADEGATPSPWMADPEAAAMVATVREAGE